MNGRGIKDWRLKAQRTQSLLGSFIGYFVRFVSWWFNLSRLINFHS
jgi:hypothetical protein